MSYEKKPENYADGKLAHLLLQRLIPPLCIRGLHPSLLDSCLGLALHLGHPLQLLNLLLVQSPFHLNEPLALVRVMSSQTVQILQPCKAII